MNITVGQALEKAEAFYKNGSLQDAERLYRSILAVQPMNSDINYKLGLVLIAAHQYESAILPVKCALETNPKKEKLWLTYIDILVKTGQIEVAKLVLSQAQDLGIDVGKINIYEIPFASLDTTDKGNGITPPEQELIKLLEHVKSACYGDAEKLARSLAAQYPCDNFSWKVLGQVLKQTGRASEAIFTGQKSIEISPFDAEAHFNLGNTFQVLGLFDNAISSFAQVLTFQPDFYDAYSNLGSILYTYRFKVSDRKIYPVLINLLSAGNIVRPRDIASSIFGLLKLDPLMKNLLTQTHSLIDLKETISVLNILTELPLLHHMMRECPLPDLQIEGLFVRLRKNLIRNLNDFECSAELIYSLSTLSLQCFINEYVWFESDEEIRLVTALEIKIAENMAQAEQPKLIDVFCLSAYRPLHRYDWCEKLVVLDQVLEMKERLIEQPFSEILIKKEISSLVVISDAVSKNVRTQYEANPFPRWVSLCLHRTPQSIAEVCDASELLLHSENIKSLDAPDILVAGCGTGQHSIETASRFLGCQVTAVDLSASSLAYAKRRSDNLAVRNIAFMQADILDLHLLNRQFDIIESVGVLHHMNKPMAGWNVLTGLLRPGGLIKIGLYSELARAHIVRIRSEIESLGIGASEAEIRKFRQSKLAPNTEYGQRLLESYDLYSLSTLRDLWFHVQEQRFTVPQIEVCLEELGLKFCGFEDKAVVSRFKETHENETDIYDLSLWHQFEESNPRTFAGMYQFWCQKL